MKILLTGGAGYMGTGLTSFLAAQTHPHEIVIYDNLSRGNYNLFIGDGLHNAQKVSFVEGDILDSRKLRRSLEGVDVVVHLAAKVTTPFANADSHFFEQVNHWGTAELVYALEESSVKRLIYLSSTSVYGRSKELADESKVPNPRTFYGISKLRGEEHVQRLSDKIETYIIRCGNVYGYNKSIRFDSVINRFVFDANYKGRISVNGDGTHARAFIHINMITEVLAKLIEATIPPGVYNVVARNLQVLDLLDVLKELYPELEFIFINQHLNLRGIRVKPHDSIFQDLQIPGAGNLLEEIREFADALPFGILNS
ncbi:MAG: SDR family oxidoreductase [Cyclobacteriaceae bacterium]|nr:SDR family oxidoreductase [Cyclobacteriaceae bacterium]